MSCKFFSERIYYIMYIGSIHETEEMRIWRAGTI